MKDYRSHVNILFSRYPEAFDNEHLKPAVLEYMAQPVKPATFNLRLVYLKAFFDWCVKEEYIVKNPLEGFKRRKDEGRIVNIEEVPLPNYLLYRIKIPSLVCGITHCFYLH
nr:hypothetical protein [Desulforamulus aquiferis]